MEVWTADCELRIVGLEWIGGKGVERRALLGVLGMLDMGGTGTQQGAAVTRWFDRKACGCESVLPPCPPFPSGSSRRR